MLVSVIIPVYNGEKYINECLESVRASQSQEMECIIVNDGSTDNTSDICKAFIDKDSRFRMIDKQNSGVSDSRNIGIDDATGKYVFFLDADDYINTDHWQEVIDKANTGDYDMIAFSYYNLFDSGIIQAEVFPDDMDIKQVLLSTPLLNSCWGRLLRKEIITANKIKFRKDLRTCEDAIFILDFVRYAKDFILLDTCILYYRIHNEGAMHTATISNRLADFSELLTVRKAFLKDNYDEKLNNSMHKELFSVITDMLRIAAREKKLREIRITYKEFLKNALVKSIINETKMNYLSPIFKKIELVLIRGGSYTILALYFKLKRRLTIMKVRRSG